MGLIRIITCSSALGQQVSTAEHTTNLTRRRQNILCATNWNTEKRLRDPAASSPPRSHVPVTMDDADPHMNTRKLSHHSRAVIWQDFQSYDKDRNGLVTLDEAIRVLNSRFGFPPDKTKRMLEKCDRNGDNKLSYDEFIEFYFRVQEKVSQLHSYFHESDKNHDGSVDAAEARHIMKQMAFNEDEIHTLMAVSDFTGDGKLQYEEFLRFWKE